jgi:hypothetical protein
MICATSLPSFFISHDQENSYTYCTANDVEKMMHDHLVVK